MPDSVGRLLLEVRGVSRHFGGFPAVDDVSLDVHAGEVLGIAGPNGAGKSTLFGLLSGISAGPDTGEVSLDGRRIDRLPAHRIARLGLRRTFQAEQLFPSMSVLHNATVAAAYLGAAGMRRGKAARAEAEAALETVGISEHADAQAGDVSLLVKKKLMIATALVAEPRLLMLDEPAGGLNSSDQADLVVLLRKLHRDGLTLLIIEHVLSLLQELADRMIVMSAGRVLVDGRPTEVLSDPRVVDVYLGRSAA